MANLAVKVIASEVSCVSNKKLDLPLTQLLIISIDFNGSALLAPRISEFENRLFPPRDLENLCYHVGI